MKARAMQNGSFLNSSKDNASTKISLTNTALDGYRNSADYSNTGISGQPISKSMANMPIGLEGGSPVQHASVDPFN